jgi:hypothetical protein
MRRLRKQAKRFEEVEAASAGNTNSDTDAGRAVDAAEGLVEGVAGEEEVLEEAKVDASSSHVDVTTSSAGVSSSGADASSSSADASSSSASVIDGPSRGASDTNADVEGLQSTNSVASTLSNSSRKRSSVDGGGGGSDNSGDAGEVSLVSDIEIDQREGGNKRRLEEWSDR